MRVMLYHEDYPDGKIFTTEKDLKAAYGESAVEAPWLVGTVVVKPSPIDRDDDILDKPRIVKNPVTEKPIYKDNTPYNDKSKDELKPCECGCGQMVKKRFVAGHYPKMLKRLREANDNKDDKQADTGGTL